jgi:hypothetical protein
MAKKILRKATVTPIRKGRSEAKPMRLNIRVESTDEDALYANYMEVSHSQYEFMLTMARLPVKPSARTMELAKERGEIVVEPKVQVIFPPQLIIGLIKALEIQKETFESLFGKITTTKVGKID